MAVIGCPNTTAIATHRHTAHTGLRIGRRLNSWHVMSHQTLLPRWPRKESKGRKEAVWYSAIQCDLYVF